MVYRRLLRDGCDHEWVVADAETGSDGLEQCRVRLPECILLDHGLPDFDGVELLAAFDEQTHGRVPVVMVTGQGDERLEAAALKQGAKGCVVKSTLTAKTLDAMLLDAIEQHRLAHSEKALA